MHYCKICLTLLIAYVSRGDACKPKEAIRHLDEALAELREIDLDVSALIAVMANHDRIERKLDLCLGRAAGESLKAQVKSQFGSKAKFTKRFTSKPGQKVLLLTKKYFKNRRPIGREDISIGGEK
ncbi:uncharacterized protein [Choristoneura fumiferana]|uniref:uncharacterized protein n=1 Tax=Choristoneura fumiferana TaxID=7141 RepID=UPI003D15C740